MSAEPLTALRSKEGIAVPLTGVNARGRVDGLLFELTVEQRYENRVDTNIEAVYTFPVPLNAAFLGLEIEIGGRRLVAKAKRTDLARRDYEQAIDAGNTAVLLERADDGLYTVSLGNLLAGESAVIRYRYAELLDVAQGAARLRIPTVIAPRYGDSQRRVQPHQTPGVDLTVDYPFALSIRIEGVLAAAPLSSPTHRIAVTRDGLAVEVALADGARLDRDIVVSADLAGFKGASVTAHDGDGFVSLVSWVPALTERDAGTDPASESPLALKILIDCSGSMGGDSIAQARQALVSILDRIEAADGQHRDQVGLARFGSRFVTVTDGLRPATPELLEHLRVAARELQADLGGTDLPDALRQVVAQPVHGAAAPAVLLVTDGEIWAIDRALAAVAQSRHRLFVVAVGAAPNEALARRIAEVTGGACEFVTPGENIERAIVRMARRVREPVCRLDEVRWPAEPAWTGPMPAAIFSGDTVHLLAGFSNRPEGLVIASAEDGDGTSRAVQPIAVSSIVSGGDTLARLAASRRLATLPADEAAALAERYQLASQWTAFVVVDEREVKADALPELAQVPQMLAAGWGGAGSVLPDLAACEAVIRNFARGPSPSLDRRVAASGLLSNARAPRFSQSELAAVGSHESLDIPSFLRESGGRDHAKDRSRPVGKRRRAAQPTRPAVGVNATAARPVDVAERIVAHIAAGHDAAALLANLATFGVPDDVLAAILVAADEHGIVHEVAAHLFSALLVDSRKEELVTATFPATVSFRTFNSILGDRRLRSMRSRLMRLVSACTADAWHS